VSGVGDEVSYGMAKADGAMLAASGSSWTDVIHRSVTLAPGENASYQRFLAVGTGDVSSVLNELLRRRGQKPVAVSGRVLENGQRPVASAEIWFARGTKPFAMARTDGSGAYRALLPAGSYDVSIEAEGIRSAHAAQLVLNQATTQDFVVGSPSKLRFQISENGHAVPAKLVVYGEGDTPTPRFGRVFSARGAANVVFTLDGRGEAKLPAGSYRVYGCHGLEYDVAERAIKIGNGETAEVALELHHLLDTRGYLSGDFHQHAANSFDSGVTLVDRVVSNAVEGLEILVGTDHDFITDYRPVIREMGLEKILATVSGDEATTHTIGHFMGFPLLPKPGAPRNGAPETWNKTAGEIFLGLRAAGDDVVVQANHPRSGSTGYFDLLHVDEKNVDKADANFDTSFDAIEVFNGKRIDEALEVMRDWMHFLARGRRFTATGNSDTHQMVFQEAGYPRNFVRMPKDVVHFDVAAFTDAVKRKHAVIVSNGPFIELFAGPAASPALVGDTLRVAGNEVEVRFKLQAAPWVQVSTFSLWQDGVRVKEIAVPQSTAVVRLEGSVKLPVKSSGYVMAMARGEKPLEPVLPTARNKPTKAFGFTNPIYLDKVPAK
jgi:hypothetical protein